MSQTTQSRTYYDSPLTDSFYASVWGGQNICIGLYDSPTDALATASQRTVERLASFAFPTTPPSTKPPAPPSAHSSTRPLRIIDLGAGYGGAARHLAKTHNCHITCLNLSSVQNSRNLQLCAEEGLQDKVSVVEGTFETLPFEDNSFDIVWSQDAFLHSEDHGKLFKEIGRVLVENGGRVVFTDILGGEGRREGGVEEYLRRLPVREWGTVGGYVGMLEGIGLEGVDGGWVDWTEHLRIHYEKVREGLGRYKGREGEKVDGEWASRAERSLESAAEAARTRALVWGCFRFER